MFTAIYLPSRPEGKEDPSRSGFETEDLAYEYVYSQMCWVCKEERRAALAGEKDPEDADQCLSEHPACACEWMVGLTEEVRAAEDFNQLSAACGWYPIYRKDNTPEENAKLEAEYEERKKKS